MSAPNSAASPPKISIRVVSHAMKCGAGTPMAWRTTAKASGTLDSLAKPCCMKPYPTISRSGMGAQRVTDARFRNVKELLDPCSDGWRRSFMFDSSFSEQNAHRLRFSELYYDVIMS